MPANDLVRALIAAPESASFGRSYGAAIADDGEREQITRALLDTLELKVTGWLPLPTSPDSAITAIHQHVLACYPRVEALLGVNLVVLEHLARATIGLSGFLAELTEEQVCLYAAVLLNAAESQAGEAPPAGAAVSADEPADGIVYDIAEAAFCAGSGDPRGWQEHVARALAVDPAGADVAARQALADRLQRQDISVGMVAEIANGAYRLAAAVQDGAFACPMYLLELVIRRALAEPGCVDHVERDEVVHATTQACGLLDLSAVLLPPGWGWAVHGPLSTTG